MLSEFGLIPDIFETASYSSPEVCDLHLARLKEVLMTRGLVRDFRDGEWRSYVLSQLDRWDLRAKELIRKLVTQKRLAPAPAAGVEPPANEPAWCREALLSHRSMPLAGIITSTRQAAQYVDSEVVKSIEQLDTSGLWEDKMQSVRLRPQTNEYLRLLSPVLKHANLLMFIDPYLDPASPSYGEFFELLLAAQRRPDSPSPTIQLHRVVYYGRDRTIGGREYWKERFASLDASLVAAGLKAEIFLWDQFHDRHFISNLIGILMSKGFEVSKNSKQTVNWARISREHREQLQREFDVPNNAFHDLRGKFTIGRLD